jgi:ABC-type transporter Mla MlaB component
MESRRPRQRTEVVDIDLDVSWLVPPDLSAVDALARLQVAASRRGRLLHLHGARAGLPELVEFVGLTDVLHLCECCRPCVEGGSI